MPRLYGLTQLGLVTMNEWIRIESVSYQLYGWNVWMDLCEWVPRLYGLSQLVLVRMNELYWHQRHIDCMYKLYGWNRVNECLDCMDSPDGFLWEWMNRIEIENVLIVWMNCMDKLAWTSFYILWTCLTSSCDNGLILSESVSIVWTCDKS